MAGTLVMLAVVVWLRQPDEEPGGERESAAGEVVDFHRPGESEPPEIAILPPVIHDGPPEVEASDSTPVPLPPLSVLAEPPDWDSLEVYQETITRDDFERLLREVFTTSDSWMDFIEIEDERAVVRTRGADDESVFFLRFAEDESAASEVPRTWRPGGALPPASASRPLDGIHIALDPGHIGGKWARMEGRWFSLNGEPPVTEGDMVLKVALMLRPVLEDLGARVTLVRDKPEPITPMRPEMLLEVVADEADGASPAALQRLAERLFYRTAEIRARAHVVNHVIKPDLVLCLHFNAEAWGDPAKPTLVDRTHFHILLNGAYTDSEVALADQRFAMLEKLLQRTHEEEAALGATVADVFAQVSGLPPFTYAANAPNARQVDGHPYLWARNLLANRLFGCPVIFMEPYVMNSRQDYARIQAGDYEGLREIRGELVPSIYREYVDGLAAGLTAHYREIREITGE